MNQHLWGCCCTDCCTTYLTTEWSEPFLCEICVERQRRADALMRFKSFRRRAA